MRMRRARLDEAKENVVECAKYMIENKATIRATAEHFHMNFSKLDRHIKKILPEASESLYREVQELLESNKSQRHLRGGESTYNKFKGVEEAEEKREIVTDGENKQ